MQILMSSFHTIDLNKGMLERKETPEDFQNFVQDYIQFAISNEKNKKYTVHDMHSHVVHCIHDLVLQEDEELQDSIAKKLLEVELTAQEKISHLNTQIKKGSLIQAYIIDDQLNHFYILAKVEHSQWFDGTDLITKVGFPKDTKNVWKSAIFPVYTVNDDAFFDTIQVYSDNQAKYWTNSFLELDEFKDDEINTKKAFRAIDQELKSSVKSSSERDYVVLSDEIMNTMNTCQDFNYTNYVDDLMDRYKPINEDLEIEAIKQSLLALPERKNFDTNFQTVPSSIQNRTKKKYKLAQGIELTISNDAKNFSKQIVSTLDENGNRILQIRCDDENTYAAFIEE